MKIILILKLKSIFSCNVFFQYAMEIKPRRLKAKDGMTADSFEFVTAGSYREPIMYLTC